jgi:hypothetical protein
VKKSIASVSSKKVAIPKSQEALGLKNIFFLLKDLIDKNVCRFLQGTIL